VMQLDQALPQFMLALGYSYTHQQHSSDCPEWTTTNIARLLVCDSVRV